MGIFLPCHTNRIQPNGRFSTVGYYSQTFVMKVKHRPGSIVLGWGSKVGE